MNAERRNSRHHIIGVQGTWCPRGIGCNVELLAEALDGFIDQHGRSQISRVYPGLGARRDDGPVRQWLDGALAASIDDYASQLVEDLEADWEPGDMLSVIGHSRGSRVLLRKLEDLEQAGWTDLRGGVFVSFDGVSSEWLPRKKDRVIPLPKWITGVDLIAEHEQRKNFPHHPLTGGKDIWRFPLRGAHGDLGGTERGGLADHALDVALTACRSLGLGGELPEGVKPDPKAPVHHPCYFDWKNPKTWRPGRCFLKGEPRQLSLERPAPLDS